MTVLTRDHAQSLVDEQGLDVVIPDNYTSIGNVAFAYNKLTSVEIPDSVVSIEDYAFIDNDLSNIVIPDSVTYIGDRSFEDNKLKNIHLGDSVTYIGDSAFFGNRILSIAIPDSVTYVGDRSFEDNKLKNIHLGDSVTYIGDGAFIGNKLSDIVISNSVVSIGKRSFEQNRLTSIDLGHGITSIGDSAFDSNYLTSVLIPDSVTTIDSEAFRNNDITSVVIPDSVTSFESDAFSSGLKIISISKDATFDLSGLHDSVEIRRGYDNARPIDIILSPRSNYFHETVPVGSAIKSLSSIDPNAGDTFSYELVSGKGDSDNNAFTIDGDQLKIIKQLEYTKQYSYSIRIRTVDSSGLTFEKIFRFGVYNPNDPRSNDAPLLTRETADEIVQLNGLDVTIPRVYTVIGEGAFAFNQLTSVEIPDSVTSIGEGAFAFNQLTSVEIPDSVVSIEDYAFIDNDLSNIVIPDSVTYIGDRSFERNELESIHLGDSVTSIGDSAFIDNDLSNIVIPDSVTYIGDRSFERNELESIHLGDSVTYIGDSAFFGNRILSIAIPDSVTYVGDRSFEGNKLKNIHLGDSVTHIGDGAFIGNKLSDIVISNSVVSIGKRSFEQNRLTSIDLGHGITSIGDSAFDSNYLTSVLIPDSVTTIDSEAFRNNDITSVVIPDSVTSIGKGAFKNNQLTSVVITDNVTWIGEGAFSNNPNLQYISISEDATFDLSIFPDGVEIIRRSSSNASPTNLLVSASTFDENIAAGSSVATLSTSDPDSTDTHSYSLVSGTGDTDNNAFTIDGDKLKINASPDYETKSSYAIRLKTTDSGGAYHEESKTLSVNNIIEPKSDPITGQSFNLDVDGDGEVTALGDGLMIIRKLIGPAFADDALTNKARSNTATRSTQEIHDFIEQGISDGVLDVDGDGEVTALGDGLMVIRKLIGPAFDGDALTNKAMSSNSEYFGQENASDLIAANIDNLNPFI